MFATDRQKRALRHLASRGRAPGRGRPPKAEVIGADGSSDAVARTEQRLANGMLYVRAATAMLVPVPLLRWRSLQRPWCAVGASGVALAQTFWFRKRIQQTGTARDPVLIWGDVAGCALVTLLASRSVDPQQRNTGLVQAVSHNLSAAATAGFGMGPGLSSTAATGIVAAVWTVAVWPAFTTKLVSDVLGFGLWLLSSNRTGQEFRRMAIQIADAEIESALRQAEVAERLREADLARERGNTHREIHDYLLPVVDAVATGAPATENLGRVAKRAAWRARRLILDGRIETVGFVALVDDAIETYRDAGLLITPVLRIINEPPVEVAEAIAGATREALTNVVKHAGTQREVTMFVESSEVGVEVVVRDSGVGFDSATVVPGGGFGMTFEAVRRVGGELTVTSKPDEGTRVLIRWATTLGSGGHLPSGDAAGSVESAARQ